MAETPIVRIEEVGDSTVAVELETPPEFEAAPGQFVLVRASIDGEEETGYYTISSPDVEGTFETTVAADSDGTLGPWLAEREVGEEITVEGPFGNVQYVGSGDALVLASGPGIGPAIGIGERAQREGHHATIVYGGSNPPHMTRLTDLEEAGMAIVISDDLHAAVDALDFENRDAYVFGFKSFVEEAGEALAEAGIDTGDVEIENFGA